MLHGRFVILVLVCFYGAVCNGLMSYNRLCNTSSDCPLSQCCRDRQGNIIGDSFGNLLLTGSGVSAGTCSRATSRPGETCNDRCGCHPGHVCYRTITGACCPPYTCWEENKAAADRKYWDNCMRDPTCHLPPMVNPGPTLG